MNFNQVTLAGNLTDNPKLSSTQQGKSVANFSIAINKKYKTSSGESKEEVTFVDIVTWGKTAELVHQYCKKGNPILISGELKQDKWTDKEGKSHTKIKVTAQSVKFLGSPTGQKPADEQAPEGQPAPSTEQDEGDQIFF